jgi:hypothetical protein
MILSMNRQNPKCKSPFAIHTKSSHRNKSLKTPQNKSHTTNIDFVQQFKPCTSKAVSQLVYDVEI